jgi:hypothetical protein
VDSSESDGYRGPSIVKPLLIGCGVLTLAGAVVVALVIAWLLSTPESGVKMANEMQSYALEYLAKHKILNQAERIVAYYDETISMDGTEAAILTTERLIYHKDGRNTAMPLSEILDVRHHYETLNGDIIEVIGVRGDRMKIEIAPLNGGEAFVRALNDARQRQQPAVPHEPC